MTIRALLSESTGPQRVAVLADTIDSGKHLVESTLADLVTTRNHGTRGDYRIGHHRVIVATPRSRTRIRGFTLTAVLIDSWPAYNAVLPTLMPCLLGSHRVRWFDRDGELPDRPECQPD
jgi:hypothetical protein